MIRIRITPVGEPSGFDAILTVTCLVGKPPPTAQEGITLNVQDIVNFNKIVMESGQTLFLAQ